MPVTADTDGNRSVFTHIMRLDSIKYYFCVKQKCNIKPAENTLTSYETFNLSQPDNFEILELVLKKYKQT